MHRDISHFKETKTRLFERASSVLSAGRRSLSRSSGSRSSTPVLQDAALRAYELLDATLAHFMPGDINPDDPNIRNRLPDGETFDDLVSPLVVLITRFCLGDEDAKVRIRNWFILPNLDRSKPLEARLDILGRCLRLLRSLYHSRLNRVCGEMFFAMCDCDGALNTFFLFISSAESGDFSYDPVGLPRLRECRWIPLPEGSGFCSTKVKYIGCTNDNCYWFTHQSDHRNN